LDIATVDQSCPRFSDVHQIAIEADAMIRAANPDLSPRELGTLIHQEIRNEVRSWQEFKVGVWSEQGFFEGIRNDNAILPRGASRIDILEDSGRNTVCIYQYWQEALAFKPNASRIFVIPLYTKR
jgi:hypothetical protein